MANHQSTGCFRVAGLLGAAILCCAAVRAQDSIATAHDYSRADSIALNWPESQITSVEGLALGLTSSLNDDQQQFRALFRWIANNVDYRYGSSGKDPLKVARRKRAVCQGYSALLNALCEEAGIECTVVEGFAKSIAGEHIDGTEKAMRHAWNAVKLDGEWHLVDVTWASGGMNIRSKKYVRDFDAGWFLTPPQRFLLSHWPEDARWTLGETRPDKKEFIKAPVFYRLYTAAGLHLESPSTGTIGRKTTIRLRSSEPVTRLSAYLVDTDAYLDLPVMASGGLYSTELELPKDARGAVIITIGGDWIFGLNRK